MNQPAQQGPTVLVDLLQRLDRLPQRSFGATALGYIDGHHDGARRIAGRVPEGGQVKGKGSLALRELGPSGDPRERLTNALDDIGVLDEEVGGRPPEGLARFLAERVRADPGREGNDPFAVDRKQHDGGAIDDRPQSGLALAELAWDLEPLLQLVSKHGLLTIVLRFRGRSGTGARAAPIRRPCEQPAEHGVDPGASGLHPGYNARPGSVWVTAAAPRDDALVRRVRAGVF